MQQRKQASRLEYFILGILVFLVIGGCAFGFYGVQLTVFFRGLEPSCSIGLGTATVTVQAWSANDDCIAMLANVDDFSGVNWGKLGAHAVSAPNTSGATICEFDMGGRHVTVRDDATSNSGTIACMGLQGELQPPAGR